MAVKKSVRKSTPPPKVVPVIFLRWIPLAFTITLLCGLIYGVAQQVYRQSANDPQIEIAQSIVAPLMDGQPAESLNSSQKSDLETTESPFIMLFDSKAKLVASTVILKGKMPEFPAGVLAAAKQHGQNRVTWQPAPNVREAVVVDYYSKGKISGYIAVGRSLKEVEHRVDQLSQIVFIGWAVGIVGSLLASYYMETLILASKSPRE